MRSAVLTETEKRDPTRRLVLKSLYTRIPEETFCPVTSKSLRSAEGVVYDTRSCSSAGRPVYPPERTQFIFTRRIVRVLGSGPKGADGRTHVHAIYRESG